MGGFGAFHTIIEHPDIFGAAYSMKGGFDVSRPLNPNWPSDFGFETLLGTATEDSGNWHDVNILENICRLRGDAVSLGFYSGAQDEWFHEENVRLHMILDSCGIQHVFEIADETHFSIPFSRMRSVGAFFDSAFSKARESGRLPGPGFGAPGRGKSRTGENRFVLTPAGRRVRSIAPQYPQRRRVASGVYLEFPRGFRALPTIRMTSRRPGEPTYGPAAGNR
jgi:hypothetical protein